MTSEITTAGAWEAADGCDAEPAWSADQPPTENPYGTPEGRAPVAVQRGATEPRHVKVNRDSEGTVLGVAIILNEIELCRLGAELERAQKLEYWIEDGRLRFDRVDSTESRVSQQNDG